MLYSAAFIFPTTLYYNPDLNQVQLHLNLGMFIQDALPTEQLRPCFLYNIKPMLLFLKEQQNLVRSVLLQVEAHLCQVVMFFALLNNGCPRYYFMFSHCFQVKDIKALYCLRFSLIYC